MNQTKPIVWIDLEATGLNIQTDRIVQIAMIWQRPNEEPTRYSNLINPGIPIPAETSAIHGITDAMVANAPTFESLADAIFGSIQGCDVAGFNIVNFDVPMLWESFRRAGLNWDMDGVNIIDAATLFKIRERRDLTAAVKFYLGKEIEGAHDAGHDIENTRLVFEAMQERYPDLQSLDNTAIAAATQQERRVDLAGTITLNAAGEPIYNTKRNRGVRVMDDPGYGYWILRSDFPENTKRAIRKILGV